MEFEVAASRHRHTPNSKRENRQKIVIICELYPEIQMLLVFVKILIVDALYRCVYNESTLIYIGL